MKCPRCKNVQDNSKICEKCGIEFEIYYNEVADRNLNRAIKLYELGSYEEALKIFQTISKTKIKINKKIREQADQYIVNFSNGLFSDEKIIEKCNDRANEIISIKANDTTLNTDFGKDRLNNEKTEKKCPFCSEVININAIKCKHCKTTLYKQNGFSFNLSTTKNILYFLSFLIIVVISIFGYNFFNNEEGDFNFLNLKNDIEALQKEKDNIYTEYRDCMKECKNRLGENFSQASVNCLNSCTKMVEERKHNFDLKYDYDLRKQLK